MTIKLKKNRVFGGKKFVYEGVSGTKSIAKRHAANFRAEGYLARVVVIEGQGYAVYRSTLKRSTHREVSKVNKMQSKIAEKVNFRGFPRR